MMMEFNLKEYAASKREVYRDQLGSHVDVHCIKTTDSSGVSVTTYVIHDDGVIEYLNAIQKMMHETTSDRLGDDLFNMYMNCLNDESYHIQDEII